MRHAAALGIGYNGGPDRDKSPPSVRLLSTMSVGDASMKVEAIIAAIP